MERERIPQTVRSTGKHFEATLKGLDDLDIVGEGRAPRERITTALKALD